MAVLENPFSLSPNPRYCYLTSYHRATVAKTSYVIDNRQGLATIIAEVGHGKTTVLRYIYDQVKDRDDVLPRLMVTPQFPSQMQFLKAICLEFGLATKRSKLEQMGELNSFLISKYKEGKNIVLAIDEAQLLVGDQFELIRQLLNFETNSAKLITIVLAGQPELRNKLRLKKALASRIAVNSSLDSLTYDDTKEMIKFRLMVAGYDSLFPDDTCKAIYDKTLGVPREVVKLCGLCLQLAKMNKLTNVPIDLVEVANQEILKGK